jgi:hypothetical protein
VKAAMPRLLKAHRDFIRDSDGWFSSIKSIEEKEINRLHMSASVCGKKDKDLAVKSRIRLLIGGAYA